MFSGFFQSRIFTAVALMVIFFFIFSIAKLWPQKTVIDARLQNLEGKIAETEKSNLDLARLLSYFKSRSYLEREAKLKLNVRRPDENVVVIYEDEKENQIKEKERESLGLEGLTNFEKWVRYLKSLF